MSDRYGMVRHWLVAFAVTAAIPQNASAQRAAGNDWLEQCAGGGSAWRGAQTVQPVAGFVMSASFDTEPTSGQMQAPTVAERRIRLWKTTAVIGMVAGAILVLPETENIGYAPLVRFPLAMLVGGMTGGYVGKALGYVFIRDEIETQQSPPAGVPPVPDELNRSRQVNRVNATRSRARCCLACD